MTTYTTDQYIKELDKRAKKIKESNMVFLAASAVNRLFVKRIFDDGLNANGAPHGTYSTKPTYINTVKNSPVALTPKGKTGKSSFATGEAHKSTYFSKGYKQFKQQIGKGAKVNFRLFNDLQFDITNGIQKLKGKARLVLKRGLNVPKINGLIERYGISSFMFSKKERELYFNFLSKKLSKIMNGA